MATKKVFLRDGYNYDTEEVSLSTGTDTSIDPDTGEELESLTQQSFKDECDINEIVRRFGLTGQLPENFRAPVSGDFTGITDFQSAMNAVVRAQEEFDSLPAATREFFANDPQRLMDFVNDDKNRDKALELGLIPKPLEKTRDSVMAIDELKDSLTKLVGDGSK